MSIGDHDEISPGTRYITVFSRIESKSKNRFSTLTTTTVESTFTNKLHLSLSTICKDDVISNHDDVIANINHCYSSEIDLGQGQDAESVFL